jgi:hypothetical protein
LSRTIDLIPAEQLLEQGVRQRALRWVVMLGLAAGAVFLVHGWLYARVLGLQAEVQGKREQLLALRKPEEQLVPLVTQLRDTQRKHGIVRNLVFEPDWPQFLFDLSAATPPGMILTQFRAARLVVSSATGTATATAPAVGDAVATPLQPVMALTIQGTTSAESEVISLLGALSKSAEVRTLNLTFSRTTTDAAGAELIEFGLEGTIQAVGTEATAPVAGG